MEQVIEFNVNDARIAEVAEQFREVDAYQDIDTAKQAKKTLTKMRTTLAAAHKEQKAESLAFGRRLDAEKNRLLGLIAEVEDPITEQLDDIKTAAAREEAERVEAIEAELFKIDALAMDRHDLSLHDLNNRREALRAIPVTEEIFQEMFETAETHVADVEMKLRIAVDQEKTRIADKQEQDELAEANRLEQEQLAAERAELEAEKQRLADAQKAEREAQEAADAEKRRIEDARIAKDREELAKKQAQIDEEARQLAEKQEAERLAEEEREAAERALRLAPDTEKLVAWALSIENAQRPQVESDEANRVVVLASEKIQPVIQYIRDEARKMK